MFESIPKDVLGWLAILFAVLSAVLAYQLRPKRSPFKMLQGGTNPIILVDPVVAKGSTSPKIYVHPANNDEIGDVYTLEAGTIEITVKDGKPVAIYTPGNDALVDPNFSRDFKVEGKTDKFTEKDYYTTKIATKGVTDSKIVALVVYSKKAGWERAGYGLFEVQKNI